MRDCKSRIRGGFAANRAAWAAQLNCWRRGMPLLFSRRANRATAKDGAGPTADLSERMAQALRIGSVRLGETPAANDAREELAGENLVLDLEQSDEAQDDAEAAREPTSKSNEPEEHPADTEILPRFLSVTDQAHGADVFRRIADSIRDKFELARDRIASWDLDALDTRALALSAIAAFVSVLAFGGILARLDQKQPHASIDLKTEKLPAPLSKSGAHSEAPEAGCANPPCAETNVTIAPLRESSPEFRFAFADRLPAVYLSAAMTTSLQIGAPPAPPETPANNVGLFRIRNLPPDAKLSAGTKVGSGEWEISGSDVNNLIVTLPRRALVPVNAEIALMRPDGTQAGQVAVAIEQSAAHADATPETTSPRKRNQRKTKPKQLAVAPATNPPLEPEPAAPPVEEAADAPPFPIFQALAPAPPSEPVPGLFNGTFLFLPGPMGLGVQPEPETTAGTDTLINLGVMPR